MIRHLLCVSALISGLGCSSSHEGGDASDDARVTVDSSTSDTSTRDTGGSMDTSTPPDTTPPLDTSTRPDATVPPDATISPEWIPLAPTEADCMGLTDPACASCHQRDGTFFLRPLYGPPPPPGVEFTDPAECGIDIDR